MKKTLILAIAFVMLFSVLPAVGYADEPTYQTLSTGNAGEAVQKLQQRLVELNYPIRGGVDGDYGGATSEAAIRFQHTVGLPETGIADEATQAALFSDSAAVRPDVMFTTTDRDGKSWDESMLSDYKLILINLWEPWCPPCVREMPDLEKLYENYKDKGLLVLGVYSTEDMESDVDKVLSDAGTTYPILKYTDSLAVFQSGYVPTTVFADSDGFVLNPGYDRDAQADLRTRLQQSGGNATYDDVLLIGSRSYEEWAAIVDKLI